MSLEVRKQAPISPALSAEGLHKLGIRDCVKHGLLAEDRVVVRVEPIDREVRLEVDRDLKQVRPFVIE